MKPIKLTMQAFASYGQETVIDFTQTNQNLFLITGDTGAGKTTIFDAIVFALYGEASSVQNKKKGQELQSQYGDYLLEPYVELSFSEGYGNHREEYTVHRVPRHKRHKLRGIGYIAENEKVTLTMPDGSDYMGKNEEINRKLEEILGLTKNQFMQVGMIAQGEFMELLRASTSDKIPIFRKLFHTDFYYELENELFNRCRAKQADIGRIKVACQTEIAHIEVPEDYEQAADILAVTDKILNADRLYTFDLECLMVRLQSMCEWLAERALENQNDLDRSRLERDKHRDACQAGEKLNEFYQQLDRAEKELELCKGEEKEIHSLGHLISDIHASYDIKAVYDSYVDADQLVKDTEILLKKQEEILPSLQSACFSAEETENKKKQEKEEEIAFYSKVQDRVNKAVRLFQDIEETEKEILSIRKLKSEAENLEISAKKDLENLEEQDKIWRKQYQDLSGITLQEERNHAACSELEAIESDYDIVKDDLEKWEKQRENSEQARRKYIRAREAYNQANHHYIEQQNAFYDAQAGIIAREKLIPDQPCPVCGSIHHPNPHPLLPKHQNLTREYIESLNRELMVLQKSMTDKNEDSVTQNQILQGKEENYSDHKRRLMEQLKKKGFDLSDIRDAERKDLSGEEERIHLHEIGNLLDDRSSLLKQEELRINKDKKTFLTLEEALLEAEEKKTHLQKRMEEASRALSESVASLAAVTERYNTLLASREYDSPEVAKKSLEDARRNKAAREAAYEEAHEASRTAKSAKDTAEALIRQCLDTLPAYRMTCDDRKKTYLGMMAEKAFDHNGWMKIVSAYTREDAESFRRKIEEHNRKKTAADTQKKTALSLIGDQQRPDLLQLRENMTQAEERLSDRQKACDVVRRYLDINQRAFQELSPRMEERGKIMEEYNRLDSLYQRLAGKVSGSRMDIETFVQRYYLERILHAANLRFQEMSGGQFILRMYELEKAGEGKNHGLDLMVYSTVTGTEREVRTLSGGESFMAALSLALGMADQIQENSASVNLDMMFIDEGFGSLDDHSRGQAIKILHNMADTSKLIGIISHVTELKQEIEDQLVITKDKDGSHHRWVIS